MTSALMQNMITETEKEATFRTWVLDYSDMLYRHCILRGFDHDSARDFVQETFFSAWRTMGEFQGKASVKNWLFVILKNKITDHFRKASTQLKKENLELEEYFDESGHWAKSAYPKEFIVNTTDPSDLNDFYEVFERCSSKLHSMQKAVFNMKYIEDMESDAICLELSISVNNYWTILHRAKVKLRSCLEKNWLMDNYL